jgi:hypothetical protein
MHPSSWSSIMTEPLAHQRLTIRSGGLHSAPVNLYARTGMHDGEPFLAITYPSRTGGENTYGVDAQGRIMSGPGFDTPVNPIAFLTHAHTILGTVPEFVEGERQVNGFSDAARQRLLRAVDDALDRLSPLAPITQRLR